MAASAAASERNFSTFGFIQSKLRNCLGPEKVEKKLVSIKTNAAQISSTSYSVDEGSDDDQPMEVDQEWLLK